MNEQDAVRVVRLMTYEIGCALQIPDSNIESRVDYVVHRGAHDLITRITGLVDELPADREDHDYTNEWQRFKANHLPTFMEWGLLRRPKMYRSQIVIRVCPHMEIGDKRRHFEFALWEDSK